MKVEDFYDENTIGGHALTLYVQTVLAPGQLRELIKTGELRSFTLKALDKMLADSSANIECFKDRIKNEGFEI